MPKNYIDELCKIWIRHHFDNKADMNKIYVENKELLPMYITEIPEYLRTEILYETQETLNPIDEKCTTMQIFQNDKMIQDNV